MASKKSKSSGKKKTSGTVSRSAKTGRFVKKSYADKHKSTTVTSKRKKKK